MDHKLVSNMSRYSSAEAIRGLVLWQWSVEVFEQALRRIASGDVN